MKNNPSFIVTHRVAGITFQTQADIHIPHLLDSGFKAFSANGASPDVLYRIQRTEPDLSAPALNQSEQEGLLRILGFPKKWLEKTVLRNPAVRERVEACLEHPELAHIGLRWERVVIRNYARNELDFFYPPDKKSDFAHAIIMARYRNMLSPFLLNFEAVMLHGAGIIRNGIALLFLAPDEGGKSTLVRLAGQPPTLTDDQVVLRRQAGRVFAHGTPFAPLSDGPLQAVLGGIFLLEKSPRFALTPMTAPDALRFIWNEHSHQWSVMPNLLKVRAFELIAGACKQARVFRLQFPKDHVDWNAIDRALQKS